MNLVRSEDSFELFWLSWSDVYDLTFCLTATFISTKLVQNLKVKIVSLGFEEWINEDLGPYPMDKRVNCPKIKIGLIL